jgi:O-antigen ligase
LSVSSLAPSRPAAGRWSGDAIGDVLLGALVVGLAVSITLSETALLALAARLLWTRGIRRASMVRWPLMWPLGLFAIWSVVSAAASQQPGDSLRACKGLLVLSALWVVAASLRDVEAAQRFLTGLFVALVGVSLLGIVQVAGCPPDGGYGSPPQYPLIGVYFKKCARAHAFYSIYMTLAGVLAVVLVGAMPQLARMRRRGLAVAGWLAGLVALGLTLVRGAWLGFAVGLVVMLALLRARAAGLVGLMLLPLAVLALPTVHHRLTTIGDVADPTTRERLAMLQAGLRLVSERSLTGVGPGQVKRLYPDYAPPEAVRRHTSHLHNTPLQIAAERGLVGLALWTWIFVAFFVQAARALRRLPRGAGAERALVVGGMAAVATFLVGGLFEYNFGDTEVLLVALSLMALVFVVERGLAESAA